MRIFTNGRGLHPEILQNATNTTLAQFCLDETSAALGASDTLDGVPLQFVSASNPTVIADSDIGFAARRFSGTAQHLYSDVGAGSMCSALTMFLSFRIPLSFGVTGRLITYAKTDDSHAMIRVIINSTRKLTFTWTTSTATETTVNSNIVLPQGKWVHLAFTRDAAGVLLVYLWGALAETLSYTGDHDETDDAQRWVLAASGALASNCAVDVSSVTAHFGAMAPDNVEDQLRRMKLLGFDTYKPARVRISDNASAMLDVSTDLPGGNWLKSVALGDDADADILKATVKLFRNIGAYSLARFSDNAANRYPRPSATAPGIDSTAYYGPEEFGGLSSELLVINALVTVDTCRLPLGVDPTSTDFKNVFRGLIDHVSWGDEEAAVINCLDEGVLLRRAFIMTDEEYGSDTASAPVQTCIEDILTDAADTAKVPKWGLGFFNAGAFTFQKAGAPPTLKLGWTNGMAWPATDPGWDLNAWQQNREPVLSAIKTLAEQDGLLCRYWFNPALEGDANGGWYLTLFEPPRVRKWIDVVLTSHEMKKLDRAEVGIDNIRTSVSVVFQSSETSTPTVPTIPTGTTTAAVGSISVWNAQTNDAVLRRLKSEGFLPCRYTVTTNDLDVSEAGHYSEDSYGLIPCETVEPATQNINTIVEAQRLGVSILRDLCCPKAEVGGQFEGMPELECYDSVRLRADNETTGNGTTDLDLAVSSWSTEYPGGTSLDLRGFPSGGTDRHLGKVAAPGNGNAPAVDVRSAAAELPMRMRAGAIYHAVVAGPYGHSNLKQILRNGDFSGHTFGDPYPPDAWDVHAGVWGKSDMSLERTIVESGTAAVRLPSPASGSNTLKSLPCPMNGALPGVQVEARCWVDGTGAVTNERVRLSVEWLDSAGATLSTTAALVATPPTKAAWKTYRAVAAPHASARFYRMHITRPSGDTGDPIIFDRVMATPMKASFIATAASAQTGLSDKTSTKVTLGTEVYDYGSNFASSTFTAPEDGWYEFTGQLDGTASTTLAMVQCALYKNGSQWIVGSLGIGGYGWGGGSKDGNTNVASGLVWMTRGDTVDLYARISGTGTLDIANGVLNGRLVSVE